MVFFAMRLLFRELSAMCVLFIESSICGVMTSLPPSLIPLEYIACVDFVLYIVEGTVVAVGDDGV